MIVISTLPFCSFKTQAHKQATYLHIPLFTITFLKTCSFLNPVMSVVDTVLMWPAYSQLKQGALRIITQHSVAVQVAHLAADNYTSFH